MPGIGKILALTILYEIHDITRFDRVQEFASYARLVKGRHELAGKVVGGGGAKQGNVHLKWAFSEAAVTFLRQNREGQRLKTRLERRHGKGKARSAERAPQPLEGDRSNVVGDWRSARRVGATVATQPAAPTRSPTPAMVTGSVGATPTGQLVRNRADHAANTAGLAAAGPPAAARRDERQPERRWLPWAGG